MATKTRLPGSTSGARREGKKVAHATMTSPLVETLLRLGYIVRGLIYGVIGVLAFQVVAGGQGTLADPQGAIVALGQTPFGTIILYAVLIGLIGYSLWGVIRAVFDPLHKGTDLKGIVERFGFLISAISYGFLAYTTYGLITGKSSAAQNGAQGAQTQQATTSVLAQSWGPLSRGDRGTDSHRCWSNVCSPRSAWRL